jgi:hypothetical protein
LCNFYTYSFVIVSKVIIFATAKLKKIRINKLKIEIYMLKEILSVSGKPGLFRLISKGKNLLVIESLADKKRSPAYVRDKVNPLADITVYTTEEDVSIRKIFTAIKEKEAGKNVSIDLIKAQPDELRAYFAEILPDFDRERVYVSDIKKMLKWYEILIADGFTDFEENEETPQNEETTEKTENEEVTEVTEAKTSTKAATKRKAEPKKSITAKPSAAKPKTTTKTAVAPRKSTVGTKRGG